MNVRREEGIALLVAMMAMLLMMALGAALVLTATSEISIAANFRVSRETFYAADAIVERAMDDIRMAPDWNRLLDGTDRSTFVDGPPGGLRTLPDGSAFDLSRAVNLVNCPKSRGAVCSVAPWTLYAYGPLASLLPGGAIDSPCYVMLLVADDAAEGAGLIMLRAEAFGPRGAHQVIQATAGRTEIGAHILSWRAMP